MTSFYEYSANTNSFKIDLIKNIHIVKCQALVKIVEEEMVSLFKKCKDYSALS